MRRTTVLEGATLGVVIAGLGSLAVLGGWFPATAGLAMIGALLATVLRGRLPRLPWAPLTGILTLVGFVAPWTLGSGLLGALAGSLIGLQLARRLGRGGPSDDRASALIALLMIVLAASAEPTLLAGLCAAVWTLAVVPLGILSHLLRDDPRGRRTVGTHLVASTAVVVSVALLAFLALPRFRGADLGGPQVDGEVGRIGFRDVVRLGEVGTLLDDPTPVLRLDLPSTSPPPERLRGIVLDRFDGRGWLATLPDASIPMEPPEGAIPVQVQAEPAAGAVAFAPGHIAWISGTEAVFQPDLAGTWRLQEPPRRLTYTAWMAPPGPDPTPAARWLQLPEDLDPRIASLANEIVPDEQTAPLAAAEAVRAWLQRETTYTFRPRDAAAESPLSTFLFERRTGHCEYFATAAAVLLRARGVPSRVVNGYAALERNDVGGYWLARQGNAHSWIEVRDAEGYWHAVDPTPGGARPPEVSPWMRWSDTVDALWTGRVLAYDGATQVRVLRSAGWFVQSRVTGTTPGDAMPWFGLAFLVLVAAAAAFGLGWLLRRLGRRLAGEGPRAPVGPVARVHRRAWTLLERRGWTVPEGLPPVEAARLVRRDSEPIGSCLEALAWLHYRVRFAEEDPGPLVKEARSELVRLRTLLRQSPAPPRTRR